MKPVMVATHDVPREIKEAQIIDRRRALEAARVERIFDVKNRTIGIDKEALEAQIVSKKAVAELERERERTLDQAMIATAATQSPSVLSGLNAPKWQNAAVALTRTGARPTEYIGSLMARFHSCFCSSVMCCVGRVGRTRLMIRPSGPMIPSGSMAPLLLLLLLLSLLSLDDPALHGAKARRPERPGDDWTLRTRPGAAIACIRPLTSIYCTTIWGLARATRSVEYRST